MEYLLNGEIYIKRGPTIIKDDSDENDDERLLDRIINHFNAQSGLDIIVPEYIEKGTEEELVYIFNEIDELPEYCKNAISESTWKYLKDYIDFVNHGGDINQRVVNPKADYDYTGCEDFWQSFVVKNKIVMIRKNEALDSSDYIIYNNKKEMDKDFIRLNEFLDNSLFIGRKFKRLGPTKMGKDNLDYSFVKPSFLKYVILYAKGDLFLVEEIFGDDEKDCDFFILDQRYIKDKKYSLYGSMLPYRKYNDRTYTYKRIVKKLIYEK